MPVTRYLLSVWLTPELHKWLSQSPAFRSGAGKTTVTLVLLAALNRQGLNVQSFKVGPDYIDPMFHRHATGRPCRNLDDSNFASTADIARLLDLPVLLVIDCRRLSASVAALAYGCRSFDPHIKIAGVSGVWGWGWGMRN